jgi:hypothetical protein
MTFDPKKYWPTGHAWLLLKAAHHADRAVALDAWREWEAAVDFETAPWPELRIAAVAIRKLGDEVARSRFAPRLMGMRRFVWTSVTTRIEAAKPLLEDLSRASLPVLLFKGAAKIAENPAVAAERFLSDIDVLVRFADWERAIDLLFDRGYANVWKLDRETVARGMRQTHHSIAFLAKPNFEVDMHQFSLLMNRHSGADDGLWSRSRPGTFVGVPVKLPHPSDRLAILCGHSFLFSPVRSLEWVGDALAAIEAPDFEWNTFVTEVLARELAAPTKVLLDFLTEELAAPIPADVAARISHGARLPFLAELDAYNAGLQIEDERHCRAVLEAETIRSDKAMRASARSAAERIEMGVTEVQGWHRPGVGQHFTIPVPQSVQPSDKLRLDIAFHPGSAQVREHFELVLRCPDYIPVEFIRWRSSPWQSLRALWQSPKVSVAIPGAVIVARGLKELWLIVRPDGRTIRDVAYRWSAVPKR